MAVDYDPVKAHEYYMQHRKLKGRHSTKGWDETKKAQWDYAKHQLSEEHKQINKGITNKAQDDRYMLADYAKYRIKQLREKLKMIPKSQRAAVKVQVQGMIDNIRAQLKADKAGVTAGAKQSRENEKAAYEKRKDEAYAHIRG